MNHVQIPLVNHGNKVFMEAILDYSFSFGLKGENNKERDIEKIFKNKVKQFNQYERSEFLYAIKELKECRKINTFDGHRLARNAEMKIDKLLSDKMQGEKKYGFFEGICNVLKSIGNSFGRISSTEIIKEFTSLDVALKRKDGCISITEAAAEVGYLKKYIDEIKDGDRLDGDKYVEMCKYMNKVRDYLLQEKDVIHDREARRLFNTLMNICLLMPLSETGTGKDLKKEILNRMNDECDCVFNDFDNAMDGFAERLKKFGGLQTEAVAVKQKSSRGLPEADDVLMKRKISEKKVPLANHEALDKEYSQHVKQQINYLNMVETKYTNLNKLHEDLISRHCEFIDSIKKYRSEGGESNKHSNPGLVELEYEKLKKTIDEYKKCNIKGENERTIEILHANAGVMLKGFKKCSRSDLDTFELNSKKNLNALKNTRVLYNTALQAKKSEIKEFEASLSPVSNLAEDLIHLVNSWEDFKTLIGGGLSTLKDKRVAEDRVAAEKKLALAAENKLAAKEEVLENKNFIDVRTAHFKNQYNTINNDLFDNNSSIDRGDSDTDTDTDTV